MLNTSLTQTFIKIRTLAEYNIHITKPGAEITADVFYNMCNLVGCCLMMLPCDVPVGRTWLEYREFVTRQQSRDHSYRFC